MAAIHYFYGLLINNACLHVHVPVKTNVKMNIIKYVNTVHNFVS